MSSIRLEQLSKTYPNGSVAVRDLDLGIADGELFVILGPSGCGKTTVLRLIAGLEEPDHGDVLIDEARVNDIGPRDRDVAMVSQGYAVYPHMTVAANIGFPLRVVGVDVGEVDRRVAEIAQSLDLGEVIDQYPPKLSGGQQQRVALGRSIIRDPRILLMDEPTSHLDSRLRIESRAAILKLHQRLGTTTVLVTHDQAEAMSMADRVAVMRDGVVVQCDRPTEVYERPVDLFVATFMGSPPMCTLLATVTRDPDGGLAVLIGDHLVALDASALDAAPALADMEGRDIVVGIRPEAVHRDDAGELVTSPVSTQLLGAERLVEATIDARSVSDSGRVVTTSSDRTSTIHTYVDAHETISQWEPLRLRVDTARLYFFDPSSGAAMRSRS